MNPGYRGRRASDCVWRMVKGANRNRLEAGSTGTEETSKLVRYRQGRVYAACNPVPGHRLDVGEQHKGNSSLQQTRERPRRERACGRSPAFGDDGRAHLAYAIEQFVLMQSVDFSATQDANMTQALGPATADDADCRGRAAPVFPTRRRSTSCPIRSVRIHECFTWIALA